jgi:hypothetical protein
MRPTNGREAVEAIFRADPQLILPAIMMPESKRIDGDHRIQDLEVETFYSERR